MAERVLYKRDDIIITDADIDEAIRLSCVHNDVENLRAEKQGPFQAVLYTAGKELFPNGSRSFLRDEMVGIDNIYNDASYDYNLIYPLVEYYIQLCRKNNKLIDIVGFCNICNIDNAIVVSWKDKQKINPNAYRIYNKIWGERELSLADRASDSPAVLGTIAVANRQYGWNLPGVSREVASRPALSVDELPRLDG